MVTHLLAAPLTFIKPHRFATAGKQGPGTDSVR
jgi:hypothetical protein